jgi:SAM-dependent methyltransferase
MPERERARYLLNTVPTDTSIEREPLRFYQTFSWSAARTEPPALYELAALYDRAIRPGPCEAFYRDLARQADGPVLELACGTGRLTIPLARCGRDVVGLDAAPAMLDAARTKAMRENVEISYVEGDMRHFNLGRRFQLIIVSCNSLAHLLDNDAVRACFACIRHHLAPGGLLAFDIVNPDVKALAAAGSESMRLDEGPNPSSAIAVEEQAAYDPVQQILTSTWRVCEGGEAGELAPLQLRHIFPQELPLQLAAVGLELVARYGDFCRNPLTAGSLNQVCIARRAADARQARRPRRQSRRTSNVQPPDQRTATRERSS